MALREFLDEFAAADGETTLSVINRAQPSAVSRMLESLFAEQSVSVSEAESVLSESDVVQLRRDGSVVAESDFADVRDAVLTVNSDTYITGSRPLRDVETPDVVRDLAGTRFRVRGYPDTSKGKLLLIEISRHIEARAVRRGRGELHTGFQQLSRIADERGTERAYEQLAETDLDVHLYGAGDARPLDSRVTVHADDAEEIRNGWFVVFDPRSGAADASNDTENVDDDAAETSGAVLVALRNDDREWEGVWVTNTESARRVAAYLDAEYGTE